MTLAHIKAVALAMLGAIALAVPVEPRSAYAATNPTNPVKNIVLVHGAWADGSSWSKIIPLLEAKGYTVTAVQNPLTSLDDDVAATKRVLDLQNGRVLLVGHSWAGVVITQAGTDAKVAGLVYIDAFAPSAGASVNDTGQGFPTTAGVKTVQASNGFLWLPRTAVAQYFAQDLPKSETDLMAATQGPIAATSFAAKVTDAAWTTKPSWMIVGKQDQMIDPNLERAMAKKIRATTIELDSSHVPMLSQPEKVASFIAAAAASL